MKQIVKRLKCGIIVPSLWVLIAKSDLKLH